MTSISSAASKAIEAFNPQNSRYARIISSPTAQILSVWDCSSSSGRILVEDGAFLEKGVKVTALAWIYLSGSNKKSRGSSVVELALGTDSGEVVVYSVSKNKVLYTLATSDSKITSMAAFGEDLYALSADGLLSVWNSLTEKAAPSKKGSSKTIQVPSSQSCIAVCEDWVAFADTSIRVIQRDATDAANAIVLAGHTNTVTALAFYGENLVSIAESDRFISFWKLNGSKSKLNFSLSLTDCIPLAFCCINENYFSVRTDNAIYFWSSKKLDKKSKSKEIRFISQDSRQGIPLLAAAIQADGCGVITIRGREIAPVFEKIDAFPTDEALTVFERLDVQVSSESTVRTFGKKQKNDGVAIVDAHSIATPVSLEDSNGPSFSEQLSELYPQQQQSSGLKAAQPKADSLVQMLAQAIHSNDNSLLESCLAVNDKRVIENSVRKLAPRYVFPLLNSLVSKLEFKPNRGLVLIVWIRHILIIHLSYLSSIPNIKAQLTGLYSVIESRTGIFSDLLKLSGRLDMIVSHISMKANANTNEEVEKPLAVYNENADLSEGADEEQDEDAEDAIQFEGSEDEEDDDDDEEEELEEHDYDIEGEDNDSKDEDEEDYEEDDE